MPQLTRSAFVCAEPAEALDSLRREFDRRHVIRLRAFFHPDLLSFIKAGVRQATFFDRPHADIAREECMDENTTLAMLSLIANDHSLFRCVERVTGSDTIRIFNGRVYVMRSDAPHFDRWHGDTTDGRLIGMSVNLSDGVFDGGRFQLTHVGHDEPEIEIANTGPGDAILFRIREDLRHRVSAVEGKVPRVAFAGWFQSAPDFLDVLKGDLGGTSPEEVAVQ